MAIKRTGTRKQASKPFVTFLGNKAIGKGKTSEPIVTVFTYLENLERKPSKLIAGKQKISDRGTRFFLVVKTTGREKISEFDTIF